jgi:hypothetical protein
MARSLSRSTPRQLTRVLPALLCCAQIAVSSGAANAQSAGPFAGFFGSWRGTGKVLMADGHSERIRCTATYTSESGGQSFSQELVCASDSYRVDVRSFVVAEGQNVQGHWEESVQQAVGHLTGQIVGGQFQGKISGTGIEAAMSLDTAGLRQTILITPVGGSVSRVEISLSRRSGTN